MNVAIIVCLKNLTLITQLNNGVRPAQICLDRPTYFIWTDDTDGRNVLIERDEFLSTYNLMTDVKLTLVKKK